MVRNKVGKLSEDLTDVVGLSSKISIQPDRKRVTVSSHNGVTCVHNVVAQTT